MSKVTYIQNSLTGGEFSPRLGGRTDLEKYATGAARLENFITLPHGGITRRPGTRFVAAAKFSDKAVRLIPFQFSASQTYVLEFGDQYIRFFADEGQVLNDTGSAPYEIESPYAADDLAGLSFAQSADVLYIVHQSHPPMKLSREGNTDWSIDVVEFVDGPYQDENKDASITLTPSATGELITNGGFDSNLNGWTDISTSPSAIEWDSSGWCNLIGDGTNIAGIKQSFPVVAGTEYPLTFTVKAGPVSMMLGTTDGGGELIAQTACGTGYQTFKFTPSASGTAYLRFFHTADASMAVDAVSCPQANVTCTLVASKDLFDAKHVGALWRIRHNSTVGYCKITSFTDPTHAAATILAPLGSTTATSTWREGAWSDFRGYPEAVTFHEGRLWFGGSADQPQTVWGSASSDYENFTPGADDADPVVVELSSSQINSIRWLRSGRVLLIGTMGGEWRMGSVDSDAALTPSSATARQETTYGSAAISPAQVGGVVLFVQRSGRKLREMAYDYNQGGFTAADLSILAEHITAGGILDMAYVQEPDSILWCVRGDGVLIGFTYNRSEQVVGWHRHPMAGKALAVCSITAGDHDQLWLVVERTVDGQAARYIEFMTPPFDNQDQEDGIFLDCSLTYKGDKATTISGLEHLEGLAVDILGDGAVMPTQTVASGAVKLPHACSTVHVGLHYDSVLQPLRIEAGGDDGTAQGKLKRVTKVAVRLLRSLGLRFGRDEDALVDVPFRTPSDPMGSPPALFTGDKVIMTGLDYSRDGQFLIVQDKPLPMTILAIIYELTTNTI